MLSFHSALCPDSDIARPLPPMSLSEICRSKNIHPLIQTTAKKKKKCCSWTRSGRLFPLGHFFGSWEQRVWGWCSVLPGQGMRVISLVRTSLMPFSLDPNIWVWHAAFISRRISLDLQIGWFHVLSLIFFPTPSLQEYKVFNSKCPTLKGWMIYLSKPSPLCVFKLLPIWNATIMLLYNLLSIGWRGTVRVCKQPRAAWQNAFQSI